MSDREQRDQLNREEIDQFLDDDPAYQEWSETIELENREAQEREQQEQENEQ